MMQKLNTGYLTLRQNIPSLPWWKKFRWSKYRTSDTLGKLERQNILNKDLESQTKIYDDPREEPVFRWKEEFRLARHKASIKRDKLQRREILKFFDSENTKLILPFLESLLVLRILE